ncbi:putative clathrin assembly protein At4g40080 [Lotus japonicus]|uniref:putative clathrin assembly protein At4g40080 n=1 Tax=Lotus japonicus TaxID=34305 RepID=UPI002582CC64|nr:putative clathrin assembly protein At4g40080 [Lotus japonicus]
MTKLTDLIGILKDKASQSKAALLSKRATLSLLRATSHDSFTPPTPKQLSTLLTYGNGSRAIASAAVEVLMDRLQGTNSSAVALKCLIAVHHIITHGSFILQDQLSVYPSAGGRNYLNLSNFRRNTDPTSWELSSWVRWFAQHIEQLLCTSRIIGFFLGNADSDSDSGERVSGLTNSDLLAELDSLVAVVEGICKRPNAGSSRGNKLVDEIVKLVRGDWVVIQTEVCVRIREFGERLGLFEFGEAVELGCCLKRLAECREKVTALEAAEAERLWDLATELRGRIAVAVFKEGGKVVKEGRKCRVSESDRFSRGVLNSHDGLRFPSERFL